mgnify:CR=1 FL=1|tara:strand:- start:179244 stop:179453 length:210 start_codon:yes stop_codon:yes gene_type:complete
MEKLAIGCRVLMPETPVHEYGFLFGPENKVRLTGQVFTVQPVAEAHAVHQAPYNHFWLCVAAADFLHIP